MAQLKYGKIKGTGMHYNNSYYDDVDERAPLDGDIYGREDELRAFYRPEEVKEVKVGYTVYHDRYKLGTIKKVFRSKDDGRQRFRVVFGANDKQAVFTFPDVFLDRKLRLFNK